MERIDKLVRYHMVEISPKLSQIQEAKLSGKTLEEIEAKDSKEEEDPDCRHYKRCMSKYGMEVLWYKTPHVVPRGFTFYIAHEFFDALPIHKFQVCIAVTKETYIRWKLLQFLHGGD